MTSCRFCKIRDICAFHDAYTEALSSNEDKYFPNFLEALAAIEEAVAEHCMYFTSVEGPEVSK